MDDKDIRNILIAKKLVGGGGGGDSQLDSLIDRSITSINSNAMNVGKDTFCYCENLAEVNLPNATSIGNSAFMHCNSLVEVRLPNATSIGNSAFNYCSKLTTAILDKATSIGTSVFMGNTLFNTLVLKSNTVCSLGGTNALQNTPFAVNGAGGIIYVPQALVDSYKSASVWTTILGRNTKNQVLPIEGSIYE